MHKRFATSTLLQGTGGEAQETRTLTRAGPQEAAGGSLAGTRSHAAGLRSENILHAARSRLERPVGPKRGQGFVRQGAG